MFCGECQQLFNNRRRIQKEIKFVRTIASIEDGTKSLCLMCQYISNSRLEYVERWRKEFDIEDIDAYQLTFEIYGIALLKQFDFSIGGDGVIRRFYSLVRQPDFNNGGLEYTPRSTMTFSKEACDLAIKWLDNCNANHTCCHDRIMTTYPTRLIDLGFSSSASCAIKLCSPATGNLGTPYMTLSHRWGTSKFLTLTSTNLDELYQEIPLGQLSNVFIDAIDVTRRLGIRYLWIDSLCIIQSGSGSREDWQYEAERMGDVYTNAYCNLGASDAGGGSAGLFYSRDPSKLALPLIDVNLRGPTQPFKGKYALLPDSYWDDILEGFPLLSRAWVFQERLLSSRMLHFGKSQIYWECNEVSLSESTPDEGFCCSTGLKTKEALDLNTALRSRTAWFHIAESYSGCGITFETDIFPALNGICLSQAKTRSPTDTYLAGLWESDLPSGLTWFVEPNYRLLKEIPSRSWPQRYRAPSWSWASLNRRVRYVVYADKCRKIVDIIDFKLDLTTPNRFGPVRYGYINIRGRLAQMSWTFPRLGGYLQQTTLEILDTRGEGVWYPDEYPTLESAKQLLCLGLFEDRAIPGLPFVRSEIFGITIEKSTNEDAYIRTGYFRGMFEQFSSRHRSKEVIKLI